MFKYALTRVNTSDVEEVIESVNGSLNGVGDNGGAEVNESANNTTGNTVITPPLPPVSMRFEEVRHMGYSP